MKLNGLIRRDYGLHFVVGLSIVLACAVVIGLLLPKVIAVLLGAWGGWHLARSIASLKEAYDFERPLLHDSDPMDADLTVAGASMGLALVVFTCIAMAVLGRLA